MSCIIFTHCGEDTTRHVDVSGRVIDANTGQAVPNITVTASAPQYQSKYSNESTGVSDAEGYFTIKHLTTDFGAFPNYEETTFFNLYLKDNNDYYGSTENQVVKRSTKKAAQDIYVYCYSHLKCTINVSSSISYSTGIVTSDYWNGPAYFLNFDSTDVDKSFSLKFQGQQSSLSIFKTRLLDNSNQLVIEQIDTVPAYTGPPCSIFSHTINVN